MLSDPAGPAAQELRAHLEPPPPPTRSERPPDQRQLDPMETPPDVLAQVRAVALRYELPAGWRGWRDLMLCGRTSVGRTDCTMILSAVGTMGFQSYVVPGEPLEIWLRVVDSGQPVGRLALLEPALVPGGPRHRPGDRAGAAAGAAAQRRGRAARRRCHGRPGPHRPAGARPGLSPAVRRCDGFPESALDFFDGVLADFAPR